MQPPWQWLHSGRNTRRQYLEFGGKGWQEMTYSHSSVAAVDTLRQNVCPNCRSCRTVLQGKVSELERIRPFLLLEIVPKFETCNIFPSCCSF